jgi:5-methylcytosine-specific restriction endonuclease McrA
MDGVSCDEEAIQQCIVCKHWKPLAAFSPKKAGGYYRRCKACEAARRRARIAANREREREYRRKRYYADVELSRAKDRARYHKNIEHERAQDRERYARPENREKRRQKLKDYYTRNQEREQALGRERSRRWRQERPELGAAQKRRRRARLALTPGAHSEAEWRALKARFDYRCLRCGRREPEITLTRDHVIPIGLPGASDSIENIQPLCGSCNAWKGRQVIDFRAAA